MKQLVIFGNTYQRGDVEPVLSLLEHLRQSGIKVAVERGYLSFLCQGRESQMASFDAATVPDADMALSLGGDGTGGFGYDSIFQPLEGDGSTFAQMSPQDKNRISHRGRAVARLVEYLSNPEASEN